MEEQEGKKSIEGKEKRKKRTEEINGVIAY
jgi:hypothetical protein